MYEFFGHISAVDDFHCNMEMRDKTEPKNPIEEWRVALVKMPAKPLVGQYVKFTVTDDGRGVFELDYTLITAEDIALAKRAARAWQALFGVE